MTERSYRKFVVESVVPESESAKSFYLVALDGTPLEPYLPGQHLPVKLTIPGQPRPVFRCYTISMFGQSFYRLTIKKELSPGDKPNAPHGLSSSFFFDSVRPGTVIEAKPPSGNFWLDLLEHHPVVMLAGGIGITPIMSMLEALAQSNATRDVYLFFSLRHAGDHVFKARLGEIARQCPGLRTYILYENVRSGDVLSRDYHAEGRISLELLQSLLPTLNLEYYLCGPPGMMKALSEQLVDHGVVSEKIRTESFGPSSVALRALISSDESAQIALQEAGGTTVTFARSQVSVPWTGEVKSLLQLAEMNGVDISSGCQYGDCGTCMTRVLEGHVKYLHAIGARVDLGNCLPCSCRPEGSVVLDA